MKKTEMKPNLDVYVYWIWLNVKGWLRNVLFWVVYLQLPRREDYKDHADFKRAQTFAGRINFLVQCAHRLARERSPGNTFTATRDRLQRLLAYREGWRYGVPLKDHLFMTALNNHRRELSSYEIYQMLIEWDDTTYYSRWGDVDLAIRNGLRQPLRDYSISYSQ